MKVVRLRILLVVLIVAIFNLGIINASEDNNEVQIQVLSEEIYYTPNMQVQVEVKFNNPNRYNDKVYLSYHIYDEEDKELVWEGQRTPIQVNDNFVGNINIDIDLSTVIDLKKNKVAYIKLDMIDEDNLYWLSTDKTIDVDLPVIKYEENKFKQYMSIYTEAITQRPVTLLVNFMVFIATIYVICRVKYKRK